MSVHERNPNAVRTTFFSATLHASFMIKASIAMTADFHGQRSEIPFWAQSAWCCAVHQRRLQQWIL